LENTEIAIVIPAYNESSTIQNLIYSVSKYGDVIVVDDGSTDNTAYLAVVAGAYVISQRNKGYDKAISAGIDFAAKKKYKYVLTIDADGEHDPHNVPLFIRQLQLGFDVVVGIREKKRRCSELIFGVYTAIKFNIYDPLCGLKAYNIELYKECGFFDSYNSIGTELLLFAASTKKNVAQIKLVGNVKRKDSRFGNSIYGNYKIFRSFVIHLYRFFNF
jgi:glycosyltransferase involved in cell wall biosynthesis